MHRVTPAPPAGCHRPMQMPMSPQSRVPTRRGLSPLQAPEERTALFLGRGVADRQCQGAPRHRAGRALPPRYRSRSCRHTVSSRAARLGSPGLLTGRGKTFTWPGHTCAQNGDSGHVRHLAVFTARLPPQGTSLGRGYPILGMLPPAGHPILEEPPPLSWGMLCWSGCSFTGHSPSQGILLLWGTHTRGTLRCGDHLTQCCSPQPVIPGEGARWSSLVPCSS